MDWGRIFLYFNFLGHLQLPWQLYTYGWLQWLTDCHFKILEEKVTSHTRDPQAFDQNVCQQTKGQKDKEKKTNKGV